MSEKERESQPSVVSETTSTGTSMKDIVRIFLISLVIVLPIRYFIAQPFIVRGASMEPTFDNSEYLIIDELSYFLREPRRGEVVVFKYPRNPSEYYIKRVIGLPGEEVVIQNGRVAIINRTHPTGFMLEEPYLASDLETVPGVRMKLKDGEYFVMGDNRMRSSDSRFWGPVARTFIVGRVTFRAWPVQDFGFVHNQGGE